MKKLLLCFVLFILSQNINAVRYYVNASATGSNNGLSWQNAFTSLQSALSVAIYGDEIWVAAGTYKPGTTRNSHFFMKDGVSVYGGFSGSETAISERNIEANPTTLSGDIGQLGNKNDNITKIVVVQLLTADIVIDGFRIISGYDNSGSGRGAGMYFFGNTGANIRVKNCFFFDNYAYYDGGAVHIKTSTVTFENCQFFSNSSSYNGGGAIYSANGSKSNLYIYDSKFIGNTGDYPVLAFDGPELIMDRCLVSDNVANTRDVINVSNDTELFTLSNSLIVGNSTAQSTNSIIAIYASRNSSTLNFINVTVCHNHDHDGTGGSRETIYAANEPLNVYNSIIYGNNGDEGVQINSGNNIKNSIIEGGYSSGENILDVNPNFVDPGTINISPFNASSYNYNLLDNSAAVNYGNNSYASAYTKDYYGENRIIDGTIDLGAIESENVLSTDRFAQETGVSYDIEDKILTVNNYEEYRNDTVRIYSIQGKLIRTYSLSESPKISLHLENSGIYLVQIRNYRAKKILYVK